MSCRSFLTRCRVVLSSLTSAVTAHVLGRPSHIHPSGGSSLPSKTLAAHYATVSSRHGAGLSYPAARRDGARVEEWKSGKHGLVRVKDPYHWLHDTQSEESKVRSGLRNH